MLSYRHAFHAGNFADILKHIVLLEILDHLGRKDTPFAYIDTHAGAGLYNLHAPDAQKLQEFAGGIGRLDFAAFPELARYREVVQGFNSSGELRIYPGSPAIAASVLRPQDKAWLFELHPKDVESLRKQVGGRRNIRIQHEDGFAGLKALLPPPSRRGLVLIDPSYEIKSDYERVVEQVVKGHKKFAHGIFAIWYPVVERRAVQTMETKLLRSGIANIQRYELGIAPDADGRGMTASGMIVINPPWKLYDKMAALLPSLSAHLADGASIYKCEVLAGE